MYVRTLSNETLDQVATFLRSLGEPTRLKILRFLHDGEKTVSEIIQETGASQSNVSKHLGILTTAHILASRKEGTSIYYKIADFNITAICDTVCRSIAERIRQARTTLKNIEKGVA
ncbi:MAG: winged helix-turn-helix transcriptional regulator [Deltaproteobacteria bacterium]|nr:winged helix-turn-helix transcriptional regulator [Deltaproteobacteria bacterium]